MLTTTDAVCTVCKLPLPPRTGRGRPPKTHTECRTSARTTARARQRAAAEHRAARRAAARKATERREIAADRARGGDYRGTETADEVRRRERAAERGDGATPRGWFAPRSVADFADAIGLGADESAAVVDIRKPSGMNWQRERKSDLDKLTDALLSGEISPEEAAKLLGD